MSVLLVNAYLNMYILYSESDTLKYISIYLAIVLDQGFFSYLVFKIMNTKIKAMYPQ